MNNRNTTPTLSLAPAQTAVRLLCEAPFPANGETWPSRRPSVYRPVLRRIDYVIVMADADELIDELNPVWQASERLRGIAVPVESLPVCDTCKEKEARLDRAIGSFGLFQCLRCAWLSDANLFSREVRCLIMYSEVPADVQELIDNASRELGREPVFDENAAPRD